MITQNKAIEEQIFNAIVSILGKQRFDLWFGQNTGIRLEDDKIIFSVQGHVIDWIRSSLRVDIESACELVFCKKLAVEFVVAKEVAAKESEQGSLNLIQHEINTTPDQLIRVNAAPIIREIYFESGSTTIPSEPHLTIATNAAANIAKLQQQQQQLKQQQLQQQQPNAQYKNPLVANSHNNNNANLNLNNIATTKLISSRSGVQSRYVKSSITSPIANIPRSTSRKFASLETFVNGISNSLALKGIDIALNHSCLINPIYIYGPSGVGKTHLLEGLWSQVRARVAGKPPLYMTAEQFVSGFLDSIQSGSSRGGAQSFRERFNNISYFLLDDIQYFNRKEATQTEFLNIMDLLASRGVQIVLTGDRSLLELGLRSGIISRLESGMSCDIKLPERELVLQVCLGLVRRRGMKLGEDVCRFICSRVGMSVRRVSGALNRLFAINADGGEITIETAEEILKDMFQDGQRNVKLSDIGKIVSEEFGLSEGVLQSKDRSRQLNVPRMLAMWLARKYTRFALSEIGRYFGERSHSTVVTAQKKVDQWIDQKNATQTTGQHSGQNIKISQTLQNLEQKLSGI
ncbi:MAG: AAA family ATPase [Planctomycetaceae bacterium]|nr:AAA family ATPase [Planctomycetaceae bacterium]